jgi:hypothetical protein
MAYVPFVEDLRTSGLRLVHLRCFADDRGIDASIEVIHERDRRVRKETWDLVNKIERLEGGQAN